MKIFAYDKVNPAADMSVLYGLLKQEARAAWELVKKEVIREIYFRKDRPGAFLILEADSVEMAREALADLPLVKEGFITFEFVPVGPFVSWENLFEKEAE